MTEEERVMEISEKLKDCVSKRVYREEGICR
jgi:hypothetical protein